MKADGKHSSLGLFFDLKDGGDIFLKDISWPSMNYPALYPRREHSPDIIIVIAKQISLLSARPKM
jgi:hypothetical protein